MEYKTIGEKDLILRLIKDSLISFKLISGLNALGLNADDYTSFLGDTIFLLMDLQQHEQSDFIFESVFLTQAEKVRYIDFSSSTEELDALSEETYTALEFAKRICSRE
jgi:hypothetical protein